MKTETPTFFKAVTALKTGPAVESFNLVVAELKRRRQNAIEWLTRTETPEGFTRYQGAFRVLDELISDIERSEELANLTPDNRKHRPGAV